MLVGFLNHERKQLPPTLYLWGGRQGRRRIVQAFVSWVSIELAEVIVLVCWGRSPEFHDYRK